MPRLRLATFNVENLLMRCDFSKAGIDGARAKLTQVEDQATAEKIAGVFNVLSEDDRTLTAQALAATRADVCAVQEVENLVTLANFNKTYLGRWCPKPFEHVALKEGNDGRGIDVGVLANTALPRVRSHAETTFRDLGLTPPPGQTPHDRAFRRDCLEVDIVKEGQVLTLFIVHFKSMHGGRDATRPVRDAEARAVRALIEQRFPEPESADWVILGDFNDYLELDGKPDKSHGLGALFDDGFSVDAAMNLVRSAEDRWSHYYSPLRQYSALDHIVLSPRLADQNRNARLSFVRAGVPWRVERHKGFRLPGIGWTNPKASDHCPLVLELTYEGAEFEEGRSA